MIGSYTEVAPGLLPFSVNMTTPTAFYPRGDCWHNGALTLPGGLGLTPDIRPGDTVTVTGGLSLTVPAGEVRWLGRPHPGLRRAVRLRPQSHRDDHRRQQWRSP